MNLVRPLYAPFSLFLPHQIAELALEKLFDNLNPRELVSSLVEVMAGCSQGENWEEEIDIPGKPTEDSSAAVCYENVALHVPTYTVNILVCTLYMYMYTFCC